MDEYLRKWWVLYGLFVDEPKIFVAFCWVSFFGCHIRHRHLKLWHVFFPEAVEVPLDDHFEWKGKLQLTLPEDGTCCCLLQRFHHGKTIQGSRIPNQPVHTVRAGGFSSCHYGRERNRHQLQDGEILQLFGVFFVPERIMTSWDWEHSWGSLSRKQKKWCPVVRESTSLDPLDHFFADLHINFFGYFPKWWYPQHTSKWEFLVGKRMVVGYHHFRKPLYIFIGIKNI